MDFIIGGLAGAGTTILTNPIDVVKTRLQLQGELGSNPAPKYKGTFHAFYVIAKIDGLLALQKGLAPAILLGFVVNALSLGIYGIAEVKGYTRNKSGDVCVQKAMFWSAAGGLVGGVCCNPILVVKTRLQSNAHPSIAVGTQHNYKGTFDGFVKIYKLEGIKGFFSGVKATATRLAVGYASQLTTFSKTKQSLLSHGFFQSSPFGLAVAASAVSGFATGLFGCPFDVAAIRLYNQGMARKGKVLYKGILDCLIKIYRTEGLCGWYKGIVPMYLKLAPNVTISLVIWDLLNNLLQRNKNL